MRATRKQTKQIFFPFMNYNEKQSSEEFQKKKKEKLCVKQVHKKDVFSIGNPTTGVKLCIYG